MMSSVARDAAAATRLPPKVLECAPFTVKSRSARIATAPIGRPPPIAFAIVTMSGTIP